MQLLSGVNLRYPPDGQLWNLKTTLSSRMIVETTRLALCDSCGCRYADQTHALVCRTRAAIAGRPGEDTVVRPLPRSGLSRGCGLPAVPYRGHEPLGRGQRLRFSAAVAALSKDRDCGLSCAGTNLLSKQLMQRHFADSGHVASGCGPA